MWEMNVAARLRIIGFQEYQTDGQFNGHYKEIEIWSWQNQNTPKC